MNKKATSVIAYLSWIGWLIAHIWRAIRKARSFI